MAGSQEEPIDFSNEPEEDIVSPLFFANKPTGTFLAVGNGVDNGVSRISSGSPVPEPIEGYAVYQVVQSDEDARVEQRDDEEVQEEKIVHPAKAAEVPLTEEALALSNASGRKEVFGTSLRPPSNTSSPLSTLSSLPDEPLIPPEAQAESSKAGAKRSRPKGTGKPKTNGTSSTSLKRKPSKVKVEWTANPDDPYSFLDDPEFGIASEEEDDEYGTAGSKTTATPRSKKPRAPPKRKVNDDLEIAPSKKASQATQGHVDVDDDLLDLAAPGRDYDDEDEDDYRPRGKTNSKGPRKTPKERQPLAPPVPRGSVIIQNHQIPQLLKGKTKEVQLGICQRSRYAVWGKCVQCIAKLGGDICRFINLRSFPIDPETAEITGPGYFEDSTLKDGMTELPTEFNAAESMDAVDKTELTVASILLPVLFTELRHVVKYSAIRREVDAAKHRALCDFCQSTIFAGYWFCKTCGRDYCLQCERYFSDQESSMEVSPWPLRPEARPRLQRCNMNRIHFRSDLQPVSRFGRDELERHCSALLDVFVKMDMSMEDKLRILAVSADDVLADDIRRPWRDHQRRNDAPPPFQNVQSLYTKSTDRHLPSPNDPAELQEVSHAFMCVSVDDLDNAGFEQIWARGEPIAVTDVLPRLRMQWTPDTIIEMFGVEHCVLVNCQTNASVLSTVEKFFSKFKDTENRGPVIWKLKDWPATEDFKKTHPGLYNDFCDALPVPDYTRREGLMNLYSHFPPGPTKPDIGPKMYNAFAARELPGGHGSTRLHMDVADAINLMLYASPRADGLPGCAVWDLFRAEDADKIRQFLFDKFGAEHAFTDPIHAQLFYLDSGLRRELWEGYGVSSFRIYQYPGQCVFIPAGCAHQVCNLADCIKIALDFVSPHNVARCQRLTSDFRNENFAKAWKEDVLQLYNVLWYSWLWTREARHRLLATSNGDAPNLESGPAADLSRKILDSAIAQPDPLPPAEVRSSIATKWPNARSLVKNASGTLKRSNSGVGESQSQRVKRMARSPLEQAPAEYVSTPPLNGDAGVTVNDTSVVEDVQMVQTLEVPVAPAAPDKLDHQPLLETTNGLAQDFDTKTATPIAPSTPAVESLAHANPDASAMLQDPIKPMQVEIPLFGP